MFDVCCFCSNFENKNFGSYFKMITDDHINEYHENGVVVVENVLNDEEIIKVRNDLHNQLLLYGLDHSKILSGDQIIDDTINGPRIKGKQSNIFYPKWKIDLQLDNKIYQCAKKLMLNTYSSENLEYIHPFGKSDDVIAYIDRICYRLPDIIRAEGGLGLHLDRNPFDPYLLKSTGLKCFRPIQSFLNLTDHYSGDSGGLRVIKGFHKKIDDFFSLDNFEENEGGEFFRMTSKKYSYLWNQCQPIIAPKGSLVFWDNKLPHATCQKLYGIDTREVIYMSFIPNVNLNKKYAQEQWDCLINNISPPMYLDPKRKEKADRNWEIKELTDIQKHILGVSL